MSKSNQQAYKKNLEHLFEKRKRDLSFEMSYRQFKKFEREVELQNKLIEPTKKMTKRMATHIIRNGYGSWEMKRSTRKKAKEAASMKSFLDKARDAV